jgi:hypothetical protein
MSVRKLLFIFILLAARAPVLFGQGSPVTAQLTSQASTCTPSVPGTACLILPVGATTGTVAATIGTTTFSGTVQFEASGDGGSTWVSVAATPSSGGSSVTSATASGTWQIQSGGYSFIRIRCSTYSSGTIVATLNPSRANTSSTSSGSGSGTVTSVTAGTGLTGGTITTSGTIALSTPVSAGNGGSGVANTASFTLGTSNVNLATLGTGIVKNTTTTGALSNAASSDVIGLWTGTCSSSTYLNGAGACASPSGSGTVTSVAATVNGGSSSGALAITGSPITSSGTLNFAWTGANGDVMTFGASNAPTDSGTLLSSLAPLASPTFTGTVTVPGGSTGVCSLCFSGSTYTGFSGTSGNLRAEVNTNGGMSFFTDSTTQQGYIGNDIGGTTASFGLISNNGNALFVQSGLTATTTAAEAFAFFNANTLAATSGSTQTDWIETATFAPASGASAFIMHEINPTIDQTSTASGNYTALLVNAVETAVLGAQPGNYLLDLQVGGAHKFSVNNKGHVDNPTADHAGALSISSSTTGSISYGTAYSSTPVVVITPVNPGAVTFTLSASSSSGFTVTASSSGTYTVNYIVVGNPN